MAIFFRKDIKNNSCWIAQKILSKEVKQVLQRRGRCTRTATPLGKLYCRYFWNFLSELYLNIVSMDRYQILWLLSSGEVVGYKEEKHIPKIQKEGEILKQMRVFEIVKSNCWDLKCFSVGKNCPLGKRMIKDFIKTKCWNIGWLSFIYRDGHRALLH